MLIGPFQALEAKRMEVETGGQLIEALEGFWLARATLDQTLQGRIARGEANRPDHMVPAQEKRHE